MCVKRGGDKGIVHILEIEDYAILILNVNKNNKFFTLNPVNLKAIFQKT